jgi:hypothetical protein
MKRIGYDADTGQYLFEDNTGTYKGLPGSYYGHMYPADAPEPPQRIPVARKPVFFASLLYRLVLQSSRGTLALCRAPITLTGGRVKYAPAEGNEACHVAQYANGASELETIADHRPQTLAPRSKF